jgi:hypothetical protein
MPGSPNLLDLFIGEPPRAPDQAVPGNSDAMSPVKPIVEPDGTLAWAAVDEVRIKLLVPDPTSHLAEVREGHMEVQAAVPVGGVTCTTAATPTTVPGATTTTAAGATTTTAAGGTTTTTAAGGTTTTGPPGTFTPGTTSTTTSSPTTSGTTSTTAATRAGVTTTTAAPQVLATTFAQTPTAQAQTSQPNFTG